MTTKSANILPALALLTLMLGGCTSSEVNEYDPYDTGSMDADRFAKQTYPVWNVTGPYKERDMFREDDYATQKSLYVPPRAEPVTVYETDETFTTQSIPMQRSMAMYAKLDDGGHWLPEIPTQDVPNQFLRREVSYKSSERPGTIVVDTRSKHLYLVLGNGRAMRYGVGIGRQGYAWKGEGRIQYRKKWPRWTPSENYVADKPEMKMFSASYGGLVGGVNNPLGARALYIFADGKDTLFRVHGTPDWKSVGKQVSSGCIRMFNQDVIDLYGRVRDGAKIIVL
ncbi:L,D-transpeptidase [Rhizobium setariae]|nr:L,D-transpeptidase [Rhizobium setariae]